MATRTAVALCALGATAAVGVPWACGRSDGTEQDGGSRPDARVDGLHDGHDSSTDAALDSPPANTDALPESGDGPTPDAGLFDDPAYWTAVPGLEACAVRVGKPGNPLFAPKLWSDCGTGCLVTSAELPLAPNVWFGAGNNGAANIGSEAYVRLVGLDDAIELEQVIRIADGATTHAIILDNVPSTTSSCGIAGDNNDAVRIFTPFWIAKNSTTTHHQGGVVAVGAWSQIDWLQDWIPLSQLITSIFQWSGGWGFAFQDGTLRVATSQQVGSLTTIDSFSQGSVNSTAARANHVFWAAWTGSRRVVRGFADGSVPTTYVDQPDTVLGPIALSDDRLVWLGEHGPNVADGAYDAVEIYSSPVPDKPSDVVITKGPSLPVTAGLLDIKTGGDYAATGGCYKVDGAYECRVFVVQLSTGKLWRMRPRMPGYYSNPVLGVSNDEIVLGETDNTNAGVGNRIRRLVRYKTATLDAWADLM